jgi:DNA-binding MarR family transcriptional regulator
MLEFVGQFLLDFESASQAAGLTLAQSRVLTYVAIEPMSMTEIAARFGCDPSNITAKVDRLLSLGLVERIGDPVDGRVRRVAATANGRDLAATICSSREWIADTLAGLSEDQLTSVAEAFTALSTAAATQAT